MNNEGQMIKSFVVFFTDGKKIKNTIEHFYLIEEYVYHHGTHTIKKIIFDLYHSYQTREYFPYGIHNIVIQNLFINNWFSVIFYHYYNCSNQRIDLSIEQQQKDYYTIMQLLSSTYCIYYYLGQWIINPFLSNTTEIKEEKEII